MVALEDFLVVVVATVTKDGYWWCSLLMNCGAYWECLCVPLYYLSDNLRAVYAPIVGISWLLIVAAVASEKVFIP